MAGGGIGRARVCYFGVGVMTLTILKPHGAIDARAMAARLEILEAENRELRAQLARVLAPKREVA